MFCPKCGKLNPDSEENCNGCGALLHEETEVKKPKKKNKMKIALAIISILIIACIVIFILNGCNMGTIPKENISF